MKVLEELEYSLTDKGREELKALIYKRSSEWKLQDVILGLLRHSSSSQRGIIKAMRRRRAADRLLVVDVEEELSGLVEQGLIDFEVVG